MSKFTQLSHHHKKIRIAYMGKILQETLTLEEQGWKTGHVVNALVFNR